MLLRYLILLLLFLNLGAAGWWLFAPKPLMTTAAHASAPGLRLLQPATSKPQSAAVAVTKDVAPPATPAQASAPVPAVAKEWPAPAPPAPPAAAAKPAVCLRFGPFADAAARADARTALRAAGVEGQPRESGGGKARGWNVYLPPLASLDAAQAMAEKIKATGFNDLFVMRDGAAANSIALGRFASESSARRRQAALHEKGIDAQIAPVGDSTTKLWLDAKLPAGVEQATLNKIGGSRRHDCAGLR